MASSIIVKASDVKVGDQIVTSTGSERVTKTYTSGKFVHITTETSGKKTYSRDAKLGKITG